MTPDMVNYLSLPLSAGGSTDQTVVSGYLTGHLGRYGITSPFADTSVDVVLGGEYREENLRFNPDEAYRSGDGAGQGGATPPVGGRFDVTEFFLKPASRWSKAHLMRKNSGWTWAIAIPTTISTCKPTRSASVRVGP